MTVEEARKAVLIAKPANRAIRSDLRSLSTICGDRCAACAEKKVDKIYFLWTIAYKITTSVIVCRHDLVWGALTFVRLRHLPRWDRVDTTAHMERTATSESTQKLSQSQVAVAVPSLFQSRRDSRLD